MPRLSDVPRYVTLPWEILSSLSLLAFRSRNLSKREKWRGNNAQKFGPDASKSCACRLWQVVSGHWKRGKLVEGRTSYTVEANEQEGEREWFLSREMHEPHNPSEDPAFTLKRRFLLPTRIYKPGMLMSHSAPTSSFESYRIRSMHLWVSK